MLLNKLKRYSLKKIIFTSRRLMSFIKDIRIYIFFFFNLLKKKKKKKKKKKMAVAEEWGQYKSTTQQQPARNLKHETY